MNITYNTVDDENNVTRYAINTLTYVLIPIFSILGITGNVFSLRVLKRHGLHKCSNVLLFSLALIDICYLVSAAVDIPYALFSEANGLFLYTRTVSYLLHILLLSVTVISFWTIRVSLTMPMLITLERIVVIFFPLNFRSIITPVRTWAVVVFVCLVQAANSIAESFIVEFQYTFNYQLNRTVGGYTISKFYFETLDVREVTNELLSVNKIQPVVTLVGCIVIVVKVRLASIKRRKIASSSKTTTSKTTRMLLAVCIIYLFVILFRELPPYMMRAGVSGRNFFIVNHMISVVLCMNSSWNFVIYVMLNKHFRSTFLEIIGRRKSVSKTKEGTTLQTDDTDYT